MGATGEGGGREIVTLVDYRDPRQALSDRCLAGTHRRCNRVMDFSSCPCDFRQAPCRPGLAACPPKGRSAEGTRPMVGWATNRGWS